MKECGNYRRYGHGWTRALVAVVFMVGAVMLAGCAASGNAGSEGELNSIGMTIQNTTNPFFVAEGEGAKAAAKEMGASITVQNGDQDVATQSNQIDTFAQQQDDLIVIDAVDTKAVGPAVERAKEAGIPVVAIDVGAKGADATITTDNVQAGEIACEYMAEQLDGKGKVGILNGTPITAVNERVDGCKKALDKSQGIEIVADQRGNNSRDGGLSVATDMLTANPDIDAFFAINDPTAVGVELAAKQRGRDDLMITSVDGAKVAVDSIRSDDGLIIATAAQNPQELGRKGVEVGRKLVAGEELEEKTQLIPADLITPDTVGSYEPWG